MRIGWRATRATFEEYEDSLICGVQGPDPRPYLFLARVPEDADPGEDWGVHIEYNDQIYAGYDLVGRCSLAGDRLTIDLLGPLGTLSEVEGFDVELATDEASLDRLRAGLSRVFRGRAGVLTLA